MIVTIEEHNLIGGLGSAVSEVLSTFRNTPPQLSLGVNDNYSKRTLKKEMERKLKQGVLKGNLKRKFNVALKRNFKREPKKES